MKKISFALLAIAGLLFLGTKQSNAQFTLGVAPGIVNFFGDDAPDIQIGGGLSGKYHISEKLRVGADLGYYTGGVDGIDGLKTFTLPATALLEYSFNESTFRPYAGVNVGAYIYGVSFDGDSQSETNFGGAPVLGFDYYFSDKLLLNTNAKFHVIMFDGSTETALGFNVGVGFKF